jgi:hypothetical protein
VPYRVNGIKRIDPETKYRRLRQYFSERWGPRSSLDVAKIKADLTSMRGDDPGWRKYLQNFNYFVGSLESTLQRDANDLIIYGPAPVAIYPARPLATAPVAEHTAYIVACQLADEVRDAKFPHGGPALNHKPTDAELKTILLDALAASTLRAYQTLYQQYCNRSSTSKTYQDLYNDIHDLVKYEGDGIKSSAARESDMDDSDGSRSTKESSRSSNSHSSRRNQQIAAAVNYLAQQQVASNTAANANIRYQEQSPGKSGGHLLSPGQSTQPPCKKCKSTKHTTKWCTSTKSYEPNCGKSFKDAAERKTLYVREHGFYKSDDKQAPAGRKSSLKKGQSKPGVKFSKVNRVQSEDGEEEDDDSCIVSEVSNDRPPKSILWKDRPKSKKVSKIRTVSTMHRTTKVEPPTKDTTGNATPQSNDGDTEVAAEGEKIKSRPRNLQYRQVGDRDDHSHMDRECQASGHTVAHPGTTLAVKSMRSVPSTTIRRTQRQHQMLRIIRLPALAPPNDAVSLKPSLKPRATTSPPELVKDGESSDDDSEHQTNGKMSSDPKSSEPNWHFDKCPK